jgi:spore maturation protein CgeB
MRKRLRRNAWIIQLWAIWRARQQESLIRREWQDYKQRAEKKGVPAELDDDSLRIRLRERLALRGLTLKPKEKLHILYATPLGNWEKHNIPVALKHFGALTTFYLKEHGFDDKANNWLATRRELDRALVHFVAETHARRPVDILLSYLSGWHIVPDTINTINQMGITTCAFWWDDRLSFRGEMKGGRYTGVASLASAYDLNLTNASDSIVKYLVEGGLAVFCPEGANPEHFRPLERRFEYDVSFVGACYGQRPVYINYLKRYGIKVEVFGHGWPNGSVSEDEMVEIYNRSRINLGFSGIGYSMKEMCLKGRDFEVPMTGALYLTSEQHDLYRVYKVGEEVVTYRGKSDCLSKIRYLLDHEDKSTSIRVAARQRCLRDHTWVRRFSDLLKMINLLSNEAVC